MPTDDFLDPAQETRRLKKAQQRAWVSGGNGGDSTHAGAGEESVQLGVDGAADGVASVAIGPDAKASPITDTTADEGVAIGSQATADGFGATAVGARSYAQYETSTAVGWLAFSGHLRSTAIGQRAVTTAPDQIRLGRSGATAPTVSIPGDLTVNGTFSNPSARHLKRNIIPAPSLRDVFPDLVEYEYIDGGGRRRLGYIADDLIGTDAERCVTFDRDGNVAGIDQIALLMLQIAAMRAELTDLKNELRG